MRHPMTILLLAGVGLVGLAALLLAAIGGPVPERTTIGGHWSLTRDDGVRVSDRDFRGRYMLLFFGYTACRDVCPTTLVTVAGALRELGAGAARIQPVFITVDPRRDTPAILHRYVRRFSPSLVGLTGTANEISAVESRFNIHAGTGDAADGVIDHDAVLLLVGPGGNYLGALPVTEDDHAIASRLHAMTNIAHG